MQLDLSEAQDKKLKGYQTMIEKEEEKKVNKHDALKRLIDALKISKKYM